MEIPLLLVGFEEVEHGYNLLKHSRIFHGSSFNKNIKQVTKMLLREPLVSFRSLNQNTFSVLKLSAWYEFLACIVKSQLHI